MARVFTSASIFFSFCALFVQGQKIITAGSVVTETVCALGNCDKIIASDKTSLYPPSIQNLPSIGYRTSISAEGIISLKPTLVIAEKDYVEDVVLTQLKSVGIKVVTVTQEFSFEGTRTIIQTIGDALGKTSEADRLVRKIENELTEAKSLYSRSSQQPRVLCVHNRGISLMNMAGENTFGEILKYTGAVNVAESVTGYRPLNAEALIAFNPDYILFFDSGLESIGGIDGALKIQGVSQTTAGKKKQIISVEGIKVSNFGPRLGEVAKELVMLTHSDLQSK